MALGFLLLLIAVQAPLIAAAGVLTNLLATGAAFGVAKWIFQDGALHSLLGFQSQGFLDARGPVFFFAMIFAFSMDYTVSRAAQGDGNRPRRGRGADAALIRLLLVAVLPRLMGRCGVVPTQMGSPAAAQRDVRTRVRQGGTGMSTPRAAAGGMVSGVAPRAPAAEVRRGLSAVVDRARTE